MHSVRHSIHQMMSTGLEIIVVSLVGHVGVIGNEHADALAKQALTHPSIDYNILQTLQDYTHIIEKHHNTESIQYHSLQPLASKKIKYTFDRGRCMEKRSLRSLRNLRRLRLRKCLFNAYLHKINIHPTGYCQACNVAETV